MAVNIQKNLTSLSNSVTLLNSIVHSLMRKNSESFTDLKDAATEFKRTEM